MKFTLNLAGSQAVWLSAMLLAWLAIQAPAKAGDATRTDAPGNAPSSLEQRLGHLLGLPRDAWQRARRGEPVVFALQSGEPKETAIGGLVWVRSSAQRFVETQRRLHERNGSKMMLAGGRLGSPVDWQDFQQTELDAQDIEALSRCRLGDCAVKIFAAEARVLESAADGTHSSDDLQRHFRRMLLALTQRYQQHGNSGLRHYADKPTPVPAREELEALLWAARPLEELAPHLQQHLRHYPHAAASDAESYFYWAKLNFGLRSTIVLNHVLLLENQRSPRVPWVVAVKQLYASHYFQAALELRFVIEPEDAERGQGVYVLSVNRCRSDGMEGLWAGIVRRVVKSRAQDGMAHYLRHLRTTTEAPLKASNRLAGATP